MDAVGATASIITLIQLTAEIVKYVSAVVDAPKSQGNLISTIKSCELVLHQFKMAMEKRTQEETLYSQDGLAASLGRLQSSLKLIRDRVRPCGSIRKVWHQVKWPFEEKNLDKLLVAIDREKSSLQLLVASDNVQLGWEMRNISKESKNQVVELSEMVGEVRDRLSRIENLVRPEAKRKTTRNTHHCLRNPVHSNRQLASEMGRLTISRTNNNFKVQAQNMQDIIYPLMSLKPDLLKILPGLVGDGEMNLTDADAAWLEDELDGLLRSVQSACGYLSTNLVQFAEKWHAVDQITALGRKRKRGAEDQTEDSNAGPSHKRRYNRPIFPSFRRHSTETNSYRCYQTRMGSLSIWTELQKKNSALIISFSFTPDHNLLQEYRTGFTTIFRRYFSQQKIERGLTTFRVVEWGGSALEAVANGDLDTLKNLFSSREAFPTDRLLDNENNLIGVSSHQYYVFPLLTVL